MAFFSALSHPELSTQLTWQIAWAKKMIQWFYISVEMENVSLRNIKNIAKYTKI
jgi:hypothetical protein